MSATKEKQEASKVSHTYPAGWLQAKLHDVKQEHKYQYRQLTNAGIVGLSYLLPKRNKNAMRKQHYITPTGMQTSRAKPEKNYLKFSFST